MTKVPDLQEKWMEQQNYRQAHEELATEFALAHAVIEAGEPASPPKPSNVSPPSPQPTPHQLWPSMR